MDLHAIIMKTSTANIVKAEMGSINIVKCYYNLDMRKNRIPISVSQSVCLCMCVCVSVSLCVCQSVGVSVCVCVCQYNNILIIIINPSLTIRYIHRTPHTTHHTLSPHTTHHTLSPHTTHHTLSPHVHLTLPTCIALLSSVNKPLRSPYQFPHIIYIPPHKPRRPVYSTHPPPPNPHRRSSPLSIYSST